MKFAFTLFNYYPYGGLERNFLRIAKTCLARGHQVHVFTMRWQGEKPDAIRLTTVPRGGFANHRRCMSFVNGLKKAAVGSEFDLVVGFDRMPGLDLYCGADLCHVLNVIRQRSHLSLLLPRHRIYAAFEKAVFSPESRTEILYLTESQKDEYVSVYGTPEERFHYLPPGIDKERIRFSMGGPSRQEVRAEFNLHNDHKLLLMVGSDFSRKGVERAIKALASLPQQRRAKTHLFVIGKGRPRPLKKLAAQLGVEEMIRFLGGRQDVPRFLSTADLLLHPAVSENAGNAILEALVAGLPVLATNNCGYAFHVEKASAGKTIEGRPFRQGEMNEALLAMLTLPDKGQWRKNAFLYADETDLYSGHQVAVKVMEELARRRAHH